MSTLQVPSRQVSPESFGALVVPMLPFVIGIAYRLDLSLAFLVAALFFAIVLPLALRPLGLLVSPRVLRACAFIVGGGLASLVLMIAGILMPGLEPALGVWVPVLAAGGLFLPDGSSPRGPGEELRRNLKVWLVLAGTLPLTGAVRELIGNGGIFLRPDALASLGFGLPEGFWPGFGVLAMAPGIFFLGGIVLLLQARRNQGGRK